MVSISSILFSFFVNFAANCSLLSDTTLSGNSCNFYTLSLNNHTSSSAKASFVVVTKYIILDNLSQTTRIMSFSATSGNFVIKSTITYVHSFLGILLNFNFSASASILFFIFNTYHSLLHISICLLSPLAINSFLSSVLSSSTFLYVLSIIK